MTDWDRLEGLARQSASQWRKHWLYQDLLQEALLAAWQNEDEPDAHIVRIGRNRVVDAVRVMLGRTGTHKFHGLTGQTGVEDWHETLVTYDDSYDAALELGVSGRDALIVEMLAAGARRTDIAEVLDVCPARVSQLVGSLRRRLAH